jgi:hypothetical protein
MRTAFLALALALISCGRAEPPPPLPDSAADEPRTWFICDGVDAPSLLVFERDGAVVRMAEYDKPNGAIVAREDFALGMEEAAAGSVYTPLLLGGAEAGAIARTNPAMLENPSAAYTPRIANVRLGERAVTCRWLPRTRFFGMTGRRSFIVNEDADGDLIYTAFDFASIASPQIELTENGVSTPFSVEVRNGREMTAPEGVHYRFSNPEGYTYAINARTDGRGALEVLRNGASVQIEEIIALQFGEGPEE